METHYKGMAEELNQMKGFMKGFFEKFEHKFKEELPVVSQ